MTLSNGKVITFSKMDNGATAINEELTNAEWEEYCTIIKTLTVTRREYETIHSHK
ncbi:MAG: hypothetical protein ACRCZI_03005 [Cetobacterium sp.]